jgi:hypothetical protein
MPKGAVTLRQVYQSLDYLYFVSQGFETFVECHPAVQGDAKLKMIASEIDRDLSRFYMEINERFKDLLEGGRLEKHAE